MNHHQILDYRRFAAKQTNDFLNEQCRLIKKYAKNQMGSGCSAIKFPNGQMEAPYLSLPDNGMSH